MQFMALCTGSPIARRTRGRGMASESSCKSVSRIVWCPARSSGFEAWIGHNRRGSGYDRLQLPLESDARCRGIDFHWFGYEHVWDLRRHGRATVDIQTTLVPDSGAFICRLNKKSFITISRP